MPQAKREIRELANELQARFGSVEKGTQDNDRIQRLEQVIEPSQLSELKRDIETIKAVDQKATFHSRAISIGHGRSQDFGIG
ncbi:hypothetical protein [Ochrobactrum sp. RH2CCR150]|uniref:hypothetical protein n=1 Tax=Ochrobactrum sp. RH2CCR150 TaxID=2587044 RepID=UPI0015FAC002|nr:trimethylamine:corrinoid methyltransferase-like protein [Ochrobactrum sp. RH2CCR150]